MIKCTRFTSHEKGNLIGFADLFVEKWGVEIRDVTYWRKPDGQEWVSFPCQEFLNSKGEKKYRYCLQFKEAKHQEAFIQAAKKAIRERIVEDGKVSR